MQIHLQKTYLYKENDIYEYYDIGEMTLQWCVYIIE